MADVKSRYEVIAELEEKKRRLIFERESFPDKVRKEKREIRDAEREVQDKQEELVDLEANIEGRIETINELIKSVADSLARLAELSKSKL